MKYKNLTDTFVAFSIPKEISGVVWYNVEPNNVIEVPDSEGWRAEAFGLIRVDKIKEIVKKTEKSEKYSKTDLMDMTKSEQASIIKGFGENNVPFLEKDRVNLILKIQK